MDPPDAGPLPSSSFIEENVPSHPPQQQTTVTKEVNVHRKGEVLALAKLRAATEKERL